MAIKTVLEQTAIHFSNEDVKNALFGYARTNKLIPDDFVTWHTTEIINEGVAGAVQLRFTRRLADNLPAKETEHGSPTE